MKSPVACVVLIAALFSGKTALSQSVVDGIADLSSFDATTQGPIKLDGTWEFYWQKLLGPDDFKTDQHPEFIYAPGSWHRQGNYTAQGYGTYRVRLKLPPQHRSLSLYLPVINASSNIFVNGALAAQTGIVSSDVERYSPKLAAAIVSIPEDQTDVEIILQAANFTYFSGGIAGYPLLDTSSAILLRVNRANGIENFFAGSLIALFIYQIILYFLYHRGKPYLWLALICLGVALRAMIVHGGSFLLPNLFPSIDWEIWKKIEFGSVYAIVALFPLYVYHLFHEHASKKPIIFFVSLSGILVSLVLFTKQYFYGKFLDACHLGLLLGFIYAVYSISKAWRAGNKDARIILLGVIVSFPFILAEILKNSFILGMNIQFLYMVEIGVLVFLTFQVYLLANHYAQSYRHLELMNKDLEKIVAERTSELVTANTVKDRLLSVMSHDIKSPLNSLRGLLQIFNKGALTKEEFHEFTQHVESDLNKTTVLVENILYWTASQLKGVQVKMETFDVNAIIRDNVELFKTIAANKKICLRNNSSEKILLYSDPNIINLVIRNLISNAIKFSFEGDVIAIDVSRDNGTYRIDVSDEGVGIEEDTLQRLFEQENSYSTIGTGSEHGTGLGLALCREYLDLAGGRLTATSEKGKGSKFSIELSAEAEAVTA